MVGRFCVYFGKANEGPKSKFIGKFVVGPVIN